MGVYFFGWAYFLQRCITSALLYLEDYDSWTAYNNYMQVGGIQASQANVRHAIELVSTKKTYQMRLFIFMCFLFHILAYSAFSQNILFMNPQFKCQDSGDLAVPEDQACNMLDFCTLENSYTLTVKLGLYCGNRENDRNLIQSVFGIGAVMGVFIINWIAEKKGKRFALILGILLAAIHSYCLLLGAYYSNTNFITASQFLSGFSYTSVMTLSFLLLEKFIPNSYMKYGMVILYVALSGLGQIMIALYNIVFNNWEIYVTVLVIPYTILLIASFWIIKEDPIYLYNNNRMQSLKQEIQQIGAINKAEFFKIEEALDLFNRLSRKTTKQSLSESRNRNNNSQLFTLPVMSTIFIMAGCSLANNSVYFGSEFQIESMGLSPNTNLIAFGITEMVNYCLTLVIMPYLPSSKTLVNITGLIVGVLSLFILSDLCKIMFVQMTVIVLIRFFCNTYGIFYSNYYVENLPKKIESSASGMIEGLGNIGKIVAPFGVRVSNGFKLNPLAFFGIIQLTIGLVPTFFLKNDSEKDSKYPEFPKQNNQLAAK